MRNNVEVIKSNATVYYRIDLFTDRITPDTIKGISPSDYYLPFYSFVPLSELHSPTDIYDHYARGVPQVEVPSPTGDGYDSVALYDRSRDIRHGDLIVLNFYETGEEPFSTLFMVVDKKISKTLKKAKSQKVGILPTNKKLPHDMYEMGVLPAAEFYLELLPRRK